MQAKRTYIIGTIIMIPVFCMILSVLFPEVRSEAETAEAIVQESGTRIKPETERNGILEVEFAENPQNRTTNGRIGAPSGFPDELSAMPCCNTSNTFNALGTLEEDDEPEAEEETSVERMGTDLPGSEDDPEECPAEADAETLASASESAEAVVPIYRVDGELLNPDLQRYAYETLESMGISWYYPTFLCQIYQESGFRQSAVSPQGDYGLCQLKGIYHDSIKEAAGIPWADLVADPYANIYAGAYLMSSFLEESGDLYTAISAYNTGFVTIYNPEYVNQVMQWVPTLEEVEQ